MHHNVGAGRGGRGSGRGGRGGGRFEPNDHIHGHIHDEPRGHEGTLQRGWETYGGPREGRDGPNDMYTRDMRGNLHGPDAGIHGYEYGDMNRGYDFRPGRFGSDKLAGPGRGYHHGPHHHRPHDHYMRSPLGLCLWCISDRY